MKNRVIAFLSLVLPLMTCAGVNHNKRCTWYPGHFCTTKAWEMPSMWEPEIQRMIAEINWQIPKWETVDKWTAEDARKASSAFGRFK